MEYAYKLLENEQMPGWLFMPKMHANTIWESWEGTQAQGGIASLDHYSKGAVLEWVFSEMCGIKVAGEMRLQSPRKQAESLLSPNANIKAFTAKFFAAGKGKTA